MMKKTGIILFCILVFQNLLLAQTENFSGGEYIFDSPELCLSESDRAAIKQKLAQNITLLKEQGVIKENNPQNKGGDAIFIWPLEIDPELEWNSYYGISGYVDQDAGDGILDYNCGFTTYNGHKGSDYFTWPFPWYLYENDFV